MKNKIEKDFEVLSKKYYERFGENFPLIIVEQTSFEEICQEIKKCLKNNNKKKVVLKKGIIY